LRTDQLQTFPKPKPCNYVNTVRHTHTHTHTVLLCVSFSYKQSFRPTLFQTHAPVITGGFMFSEG